MFLEIELLYFIAMIATFIILLLVAKMPSGLCLMCSALVGGILFACISGEAFSLRYFVEGAFGYFDTILVIVAAMIFIGGMEASGGLDYISVKLVKAFRKFPTILMITFMLIIMLPGMITGSSLASIISAGAIVAPIMLKMGLPKAKVGSIIAFGAIFGMIAPPINIPVMVICDVVDIPYTGFTLPLILLTLPLAIFAVIFLTRGYSKKSEGVKEEKNKLENIIILSVLGAMYLALGITAIVALTAKEGAAIAAYSKLLLALTIIYGIMLVASVLLLILGKPYCTKIEKEEISEIVDLESVNGLNATVLIPLILLVVMFVLQSVLPSIVGMFGTPLLFVISFIPTIFVGRKKNSLMVVYKGVQKSFSAMALLMGVGMFIEVMTWNGVRGYFVINALCLPSVWRYISMIVAMPIFGGISAFGSASILGGPYVMALYGVLDEIIVASALSLVAATGEFLPPTAMSATFAGQVVGEKKYIKLTKAALIPLAVTLAYCLVFIIVVGQYWI